MRPRVFIAMASGILGGPGKGLTQFFRCGGLDRCEPLMVAYNRRPDGSETEFIREMRAAGVAVKILHQRRTLDPDLVRQALLLLREHKSELLQSHGYKSHVLCWLLRMKTGLPWVAFVHGWTAEDFKIRLYNGLEHIMLLFADRVVAVSESVRSRLLPPVRWKCSVIPNAVAARELHDAHASTNADAAPGLPVEEQLNAAAGAIRKTFGIPSEVLVAGVVGRLSPEKGHMVFLRALAEARKSCPALHGLIIGQGQEKERLESAARELGLEGCCAFTGHVRGLAPYYRAMDMLVLPSFSEGMPNAALEGMLMGLPVVASAVGGVPEVVRKEETGLLVPAGDVNALSAALLRLAQASAQRSRLGRAGLARAAAAHSPEGRVRRICALYRKMLPHRAHKEFV